MLISVYFILLLASSVSESSYETDKALLHHRLNPTEQEKASENVRDMKLTFEKSDLAKAAAKFSKDGHIIFTGADLKYRDMLLNWVLALEMLGIREYLILCYDRELYDLVGHWDSDKRGGGRGVLITLDHPSKPNFLMAKLFAMDVMINLGYAATWVDTDGIFLRGDFIEKWILPGKGKMDLIGQMARAPLALSEMYGPTLCTGLFTMFPTARTTELIKRIIHVYEGMTEIEFQKLSAGDQAISNYVLEELDHALPVFTEHGEPVEYGFSSTFSMRESSEVQEDDLQAALNEVYGHHDNEIDYWSLMLRSHAMYDIDKKMIENLPDDIFRMGILPYPFFPRGNREFPFERHWDQALILGYIPFYWHVAPFRPCDVFHDNKPGSMRTRRVFFQSLETQNITTFDEYKDSLHRDIALYDYCSREDGAMEGTGGCSDPVKVQEIKAEIRRKVEEAKSLSADAYPSVEREDNILERYYWKSMSFHKDAPEIAVLHPLINDERSQVEGCGGKDYVSWTVKKLTQQA